MMVFIGQFIFCERLWEAELANDRSEWVDSEGGEVTGRLWEGGKGMDVFVENEAELKVKVSTGSGGKRGESKSL